MMKMLVMSRIMVIMYMITAKVLYSRMMEMRRTRPKENLEIFLRKREGTNSTGKASINAIFGAKLLEKEHNF